jgi:hypothetical protein
MDRIRRLGHPFDLALFGLVPLILTSWILAVLWIHEYEGTDFHRQFWIAGLRVLHGVSPYTLSTTRVEAGIGFPYPGVTAVFFAPFALLSANASSALYAALSIAAAMGTLRMLNVQDWRLYGFVLLLNPIASGWQTGNLTLPLVFGVATIWRYRNRNVTSGLVTALIICLKPFVWPMALWLVATRRYAAAAYAAVFGAAFNGIAWAVLGFDQVRLFLKTSSYFASLISQQAYGLISLAMGLHASHRLGIAIAVAVSTSLAAACVIAGRRGRDYAALVLAVVLMLSASPIVWSHYFALLIVPLAIACPRLAPAWGLQLVLWLCPVGGPFVWQRLTAVGVVALTTYLLLHRTEASAAALQSAPLDSREPVPAPAASMAV